MPPESIPPPSHPQDAWASGDAYEPFMGRWSRLVARQFLSWLAIAPGSRWLEVGCGTGALSGSILAEAAPSRFQGIDRSPDFVAYARRQIRDPRAHFTPGDAQALPLESHDYDVAVSGLVLNFIPQPALALSEMRRVVRPAGVVAVYVWDYAAQMQMLRYFWDAVMALDPAASGLDEGHRFPLCQPGQLAALFRDAGLERVETRAIEITTAFKDFDDFWTPFLGGQGPAPGYVQSLDQARRITLQERLRAALPVAADGSISLVARAWAVRGVCPESDQF